MDKLGDSNLKRCLPPPRKKGRVPIELYQAYKKIQKEVQELKKELCVSSRGGEVCHLRTCREAAGQKKERFLTMVQAKEEGLQFGKACCHEQALEKWQVILRMEEDAIRKRNDLALKNAGLVAKQATMQVQKIRRQGMSSLSMEDFFQIGMEQLLLKAVERFDPDKGFQFSTYASWWIQHGMDRMEYDVGNMVRTPTHLRDLANRIRRVERKAELQGLTLSNAQIAAIIGEKSVEKVRLARLRGVSKIVSTATPVFEEEGVTVEDKLPDDSCDNQQDLADITDMTSAANIAREVIRGMNARDRMVVERRILADEPETLQAVAKDLNISRERVRQIQAEALHVLRNKLKSRGYSADVVLRR